MQPVFIIAGRINREYLLPPAGQPVLDAPGGNLLYTAGGLAVWDKQIGLLSRVGQDFPEGWLKELESSGLDIQGIRVLANDLDLRAFIAYTSSQERSQTNPVTHFARRQLTFPKSLLGYQPPIEPAKDSREPDPLSPTPLDVPKSYREAECIHLCPMVFANQTSLVNVFRGDSKRTLSLSASPGYMAPEFWRDLRLVVQGVTIFHARENELRNLFWGQTNDVWEMSEAICALGPGIVVIQRGGLGQFVYEATTNKRWEVPAYPAVRPADPTGVEDAFCGGFLAGYHSSADPLQAALTGNVSASLKLEGSGPFYPLEVMPGLAQARLVSLKELARAG